MSRAVAIGADVRLAGYELAGVELIAAGAPAEVAGALAALPDDVALVILDGDPDAAALRALERRPGTVWCSLPA